MTIPCSHCGKPNTDGTAFCTGCGQPLPSASTAPPLSAQDRKTGSPLGSVILGVICVLYLINPTAGVFELIPDNLPFIGNLDEIGAVTGLYIALNNLGILTFRR